MILRNNIFYCKGRELSRVIYCLQMHRKLLSTLLLVILLAVIHSVASTTFSFPSASSSFIHPLCHRRSVSSLQRKSLSSSETNNNQMSVSAIAKTAMKRAVGKLSPETSALLLIDVQERFRPLIYKCETVVNTCRYMTSVAQALDIPIVVSQQYTKVFGETVPDCFSSPDGIKAAGTIYEKKLFSMCTDEVLQRMEEIGDKDSYIVVGIEAHVCVQQTCLDLLERGKDVHLIVDGISSQQPLDREMAFRRLEQAGAFLTTAQSAAFMLMRSADHPNFKAVSKLTVEHMKLPNEFNDEYKK